MKQLPLWTAAAASLLATFAAHAQWSPDGFTDVTVHDPMVTHVDGTYYIFGSHLQVAKSDDLMNWTQVAQGVNASNPIFNNAPVDLQVALSWAQTDTLWAGNVFQMPNGKFHFYYSACRGDSPLSALGLATADNIEGPYEHQQILLYSGQTASNQPGWPFHNANVMPNAIDPNIFFDAEGRLWMLYGSYSGGIFILELETDTGLIKSGQELYGQKLTGGYHARIEAPFMLYNPDTEYYYMFLSYGGLGAGDGYQIRVARSKSPTGPFLDPKGQSMLNASGRSGQILNAADPLIAPYGGKLIGDYQLRRANGSNGIGYVSPGHNSAYHNEETGEYTIFFHTRFPGLGQIHHPRVHPLEFNADGWPVIMPFHYAHESHPDVSAPSNTFNLSGTYELVQHGLDIQTGGIKTSQTVQINADGSLSGAVSGSWTHHGGGHIDITFGGETFKGVLSQQWDHHANTWTTTLSALSNENRSIWAVQTAADGEVTYALNFPGWIDSNQLSGDGAAANGNPSGDGIPNSIKFFSGMDPNAAAEADEKPKMLLSDTGSADRYPTLRMLRDPMATGANLSLEQSPDLSANSWTEVSFEIDVDTVLDDGREVIHLRTLDPVGSANSIFLRARVTVD